MGFDVVYGVVWAVLGFEILAKKLRYDRVGDWKYLHAWILSVLKKYPILGVG